MDRPDGAPFGIHQKDGDTVCKRNQQGKLGTIRHHPIGFRNGILQRIDPFPCVFFRHHRHMGPVDLLAGHGPFQGKAQGFRHFLPVGRHMVPVIPHIVA